MAVIRELLASDIDRPIEEIVKFGQQTSRRSTPS